MTDRGLEPGSINGDLWPIGFDVDIALDSSTKNAFNTFNCNMLQNTNNSTTSNPYSDVHQIFLNKLHDFNEKDISQITDLTNSLPKGDNVQNLYTKFSCQELANELAAGHNEKENQNIFGSSAMAHDNLAIQKAIYSIDIFGKVAFQDGKLTLQLRNFQMAPHFSNIIEECWICKEKLLVCNLEAHKHTLHGLFQINPEYVQIDIDQYGSAILANNQPAIPTNLPDSQPANLEQDTSTIIKMPITNLDVSTVSGTNVNTGDTYNFGGRISSEEDCCNLRFPSDLNKLKNKAPNVHSTKSINDISFSPSLVSQDMNNQQIPETNFINMNLSHIDMQTYRERSDCSNLVSSDSPYLLPNVHISESLLIDKSRHHSNIYNNEPKKQKETCQNLFSEPCHYSDLSTENKSLVDFDKTTPLQQPTTKVEVGAKKRKSKLASKKAKVFKMKEELEPNHCSKAEPSPAKENVLLNFTQETSSNKLETSSAAPELTKTSVTLPKPKMKLRLSCYLCTNVYKSEPSYVDHILTVHEVPRSEIFSCQSCDKKFDTAKNYILHIKTHRPRISCSICGKSYGRLDYLNRHIDSTHNGKKPHNCNFCSKAFSRPEYLKAHINIHTGMKFKCEICAKSFSSTHNLSLHRKIHSNLKGYKCNECDRLFRRRSYLTSHVQRDHQNERFECNICLKLFSRIDVLKRHKAIHQNSPVKYTCHICKKSYSRKHILGTHLKSHETTFILKCNLCPGTFKKKQSLQKHLKIHKIKEQCNICYKFMPSSQRLQNHLLCHEKQLKLRFECEYFRTLKCDSCPKSFSSQQLLNRHVIRSHKQHQDGVGSFETLNEREKKFFCEHCSKGFTRSCNLKAHIKTHNNESEDEDMLAELPSVLCATKSSNSKVKNSYGMTDKESKYMRLENYSSKIGEISHLSASTFATPLEDLSNITHPNHTPYATQAYENSAASTYLNSGSPNSPINLSAEAITAAAYLLAYPSYSGPYH